MAYRPENVGYGVAVSPGGIVLLLVSAVAVGIVPVRGKHPSWLRSAPDLRFCKWYVSILSNPYADPRIRLDCRP